MWILNFIPNDWLVTLINLAVAFSVLGLAATWLLVNIPVISGYAKTIRLVCVATLLLSVYFKGGLDNELSWQARITELQGKVEAAEAKSQQVNVVMQEKIVTKTKLVRDTQIVLQEKIVEVEKQVNEKCQLDAAVIEILNKAATTPGASQ